MSQQDLFREFKRYLSGQKVGAKIANEVQLAKRFGVARGTIREVISHFTLLGVLERSAKRGTFMRMPAIKDISETLAFQLSVSGCSFEELKETRLLLEISIVPLLVRLMAPEQIDRLNELMIKWRRVLMILAWRTSWILIFMLH